MPNLTSVGITAGVPTSGTGTVSTLDQVLAQGTPISDGTASNIVAVKAASTAPVAADKALVVAISPNSVNPNGQNTSANSAPVVLASSQKFSGQNQALPTDQFVVGAQFNTTPTTVTTGNVSPLQMDSAGNLLVNIKTPATLPVSIATAPVLVAGSAIIGKVTTDQTTHGTSDLVAADITKVGGSAITIGQGTMAASLPVVIASNQSTIVTNLVPVTSGGCTISSTLIASGTNATNVKASAGQLYKVEITNNSANIGYLKLYNTAGTPTAGSGTPVIRLMVPGNASGAGAFSTYDNGVAFATGIGFTFTGGIADADTTSVAASAFIVNLYYK